MDEFQRVKGYPVIYAVLTLITVGHMAAMTGKVLPEIYCCIAGSLLASCGWLDALLYTLTCRVLISSELGSKPKSPSRTADPTNASGQEIHSSKKDTGNAARTVTITGGRDVGERDCGASHLTGSTSIPNVYAGFEHFASQPKPRG
jgi:hypothetical protein